MLKSLIAATLLSLAAGTAFAQPAAQPATRPAAPATTPAPAAPQGGLIDINTATRQQLMTLRGIGEARADAIIRGRPYRGKDDLPNRGIIPQNVYDDIKDLIIARQAR